MANTELLNRAKVEELIAGYEMKDGISVSVAEEGFGQVRVEFKQGDKGARWRSNYPNAEERLIALLDYSGTKRASHEPTSLTKIFSDSELKVINEIEAMLSGIAQHHGLPSGVTLSVDTESSTDPVIVLKDANSTNSLLGQVKINELSLDRTKVVEPMVKRVSELLQRVFPNDDPKLVNLRNGLADVASNRDSLSLTNEQYAGALLDVMRNNGAGNAITSEELMQKIDSSPIGHCLAKALSNWRSEDTSPVDNVKTPDSPGVEMKRRAGP